MSSGRSVTNIPEPSRTTPQIIRAFQESGVRLIKKNGFYDKLELDKYDSRSVEWKMFLQVLKKSPLAKSSVNVCLWTNNVTLAPGRSMLAHDYRREIQTYALGLPLERREYTNSNLSRRLGCYANAGVSIPNLVKALENPPPDLCPLAADLALGDATGWLEIIFADLFVRVNIFKQ